MKTDPPMPHEEALTQVGVTSDSDPRVAVGESLVSRSEHSVELFGERATEFPEVSLERKVGEHETTETWIGTQRSLRRKISVRRVHPVRRTANAAGRLLGEAWVLGALEHPNVLPLYGVSKAEDGTPLVMSKAIDTTPWSDVLAKRDHPLGCPDHLEPIEFNVRRMLQVVSALEHAHHRNIIHRDIKPSNILIGNDGTVYLDGWGLAVSTADDDRLPLLKDQTEIAGTPAYMSPEQATRDIAAQGPCTDVYLVAATLHELVTGRPRHEGENVFDAFYSASASAPVEYDPDVAPRELAAILNRAMAARPGRRHASMTELRHALESYLRHRPSEKLTSHALLSHQEFSTNVRTLEDDFAVHELFGSAYMAYQSAKHFWAANPVVAQGLERLTREMIDYELGQSNVDRARDLAARLTRQDPALLAKIDAIAKQPQTVRRAPSSVLAAEFSRVVDSGSSRARERTKLNIMLVALGSACAFAVIFAAIETFGGVTPSKVGLGIGAAFVAVVLTIAAAARGSATVELLTSRSILAPFAAFAVGSLGLLVSIGPAVSVHQLVVAHMLLLCVVALLVTLFVERRLLAAPIAYFLAFLVAAQRPELALWLAAAANLLALFVTHVVVSRKLGAQR